MRRLHRWTMALVALLLVYVATTGILIQLTDMKALYAHAPATDPDMQAIREGIMGPPGVAVITTTDYSANRLPGGSDLGALLETVQSAARAAIPIEKFKWVELRMMGGTPVGIVLVAGPNPRRLTFNALTGEAIGEVTPESPFAAFSRGPPSTHDLFKGFHRGDVIGKLGAWLSLLVALALMIMVVSGLALYFKMLLLRRESGRAALFWR
jgi:uncharacterized iron-regulated membrane protein